MARIRSCTTALVQPVEGWSCTRTEAGAVATPDRLPLLDWLPAPVPGTFAVALRAAGRWSVGTPLGLDDSDIWYRTQFAGGAAEVLHFEGLATIAEVWLNGALLFRSGNMFVPQQVAVRTQSTNDLHICFRSLSAWLRGQRGRARWRPRLVNPTNLRFARTTLLGHMPGWCPTVHPVGPWRPVLREHRTGPFAVQSVDASTAVLDTDGRVVIHAVLDRPVRQEVVAEVGGHAARLVQTGPTTFDGEIRIPDISPWWPHTHGTPQLYPASLAIGDAICDLGPLGFRTVRADTDDGGFALAVNGQKIFCRGACWTNPDIVALPGDADSYRPGLLAAREAGMNMVRVGGTMVYESDEFFALCDELGLLVWQDAMLANFDYPATDAFRTALTAELTHFLARTQTNASLVVLCGGSEVLQQAAMLDLPPDKVDASLYHEVIPSITAQARPDIVCVPNSPSGGDWPFQPDAGVAHYYGVGAYLRPLEDARRANVRFASECLALANVPDAHATDALGVATVTDPIWKQAVPRDPGAGWDFDDVRDHYLRLLFGVDPVSLRWSDFARYLDLSRAVSCILIEQVFAEWRRVGSCCAGGLVWNFQDLLPGAGWGVIDAAGRPKPAWYALRRAFRPRQVAITDEGLAGLHIHLLNETHAPLHATLRLACLKDGGRPVREAELSVTIPARGAECLRSAQLLEGFFDITHAYRFGPPAHAVTIAMLTDRENNHVIAESVHFPAGPAAPYLMRARDIGLEVSVERDGTEWCMQLRTSDFAQFLHIDDACFQPEDNWLHLPPNQTRRIALRLHGDAKAVPAGTVSALNADRVVRYAGRA